jgi:cilia- and flagella-associated protein 251
LKLFVNHRPVYGITKNHINTALTILGSSKGGSGPTISREELMKCLITEGEKMTAEEIKECEKILLGEGLELPEEIDAELLCHKILGFEDAESGEQTGGGTEFG